MSFLDNVFPIDPWDADHLRDQGYDEAEIAEHVGDSAEAAPWPDEVQQSPLAALIDWHELFSANFGDVDWLTGRIMTRGQQVALVGDGKVGKSLFCQEWAWRMSTGRSFLGHGRAPLSVLYIDAENGHADLQERFISFGATPDEMKNFHYVSFPAWPPLDTPQGGMALMTLAVSVQADIVFIDTVSRFISGAENDSDTWLSLYRCTLAKLKSAAIASVRLDHFGKDREKGSRGSSAKTQDVDHVWELTMGSGGNYELRRTHTRTGLGRDRFTIKRVGEKVGDKWAPGKTRHSLLHEAEGGPWSEGHSLPQLMQRIQDAGIDPNQGRRRIRQEATAKGVPLPKDQVLGEALKWFRSAREGGSEVVPDHGNHFEISSGSDHGNQLDVFAGSTGSEPLGNHLEPLGGQVVPVPVSLGREPLAPAASAPEPEDTPVIRLKRQHRHEWASRNGVSLAAAGDCARCGRPCQRYGDGGDPLCTDCRNGDQG